MYILSSFLFIRNLPIFLLGWTARLLQWGCSPWGWRFYWNLGSMDQWFEIAGCKSLMNEGYTFFGLLPDLFWSLLYQVVFHQQRVISLLFRSVMFFFLVLVRGTKEPMVWVFYLNVQPISEAAVSLVFGKPKTQCWKVMNSKSMADGRYVTLCEGDGCKDAVYLRRWIFFLFHQQIASSPGDKYMLKGGMNMNTNWCTLPSTVPF